MNKMERKYGVCLGGSGQKIARNRQKFGLHVVLLHILKCMTRWCSHRSSLAICVVHSCFFGGMEIKTAQALCARAGLG